MKIAHKISFALCATIAFTSVSATAQVKTKEEFRNKYYTWEKGSYEDCSPKEGTPMFTLLREPNKCYLDLDKCQASLDAATGKAAGLEELFGDLLVTVPGKSKDPDFAYSSCNRQNPEYIHALGIQGIGYMQSAKNFPKLKAFIDTYGSSAGHDTRDQLAMSVFAMGDKKLGEAPLKTLLELDGRTTTFKTHILEYLKTWESDAGIEFCSENLTNGKPDDLMQACVSYLGARKHKASYKLMARRMEKMNEDVIRAFGQMGEKSAVKDLEDYLESKDGDEIRRAPALVALINLGEKKYLNEFLSVLKGETVPSQKEIEKEKKKKKKSKKDDKINEKQIVVAAMESVLLTDPTAISAVQKQLAKTDGKDWQTATYATIALAQMGDKKATKKVVELLGDNQEKVRMATLDAIGGRFEVVGSNWQNRGTGVVADKSLIPALVEMYGMESKEAVKGKIVRAIVYIKAIAK